MPSVADADVAHTQGKSVYCSVDGSECNGPKLEADTLADWQPVQLPLYQWHWNDVGSSYRIIVTERNVSQPNFTHSNATINVILLSQ